MFTRLLRRDDRTANIEKLYGAIVAQARAPAFYAAYGVPDTMAARFDMLVLHVHLVVRRLMAGTAGKEPARSLCERFFSDMDGNLRELGVSDLAVPRQMRGIAAAYYGRAKSYDEALQARGEAALAAALERNVFGKTGGGAERLARYVRLLETSLAVQAEAAVESGEIEFPKPEEA
jgi:cytochrome b pre-mRNA-processing protein 3